MARYRNAAAQLRGKTGNKGMNDKGGQKRDFEAVSKEVKKGKDNTKML
jgi:hypothetical protein